MPSSSALLRCVSGPGAIRDALAAALAGGPPVAPLAAEPVERNQALSMLRPELPVVEPGAAAVLATSGSTGRPKGVVLSRSALTAAADAVHERLGGPGGWLLALPPHYVAGFGVLVRALVAGTEVAVVEPGLADLPAALGRLRGRRYLSLVPTQLARALDRPAVAEALTALDAVLLGGAAASPRLLERAGQAGIRLVTTYGMSETGGGCVYDGVPLPGVSVDLDGDGRIRLGGPMLFSGYRLDPARTRRALVGGRFRSGDRGHWAGGRLAVDGRLDDVVSVGGRNVDVAAVEREVRAWAEARDGGGEAAVVAVPDPAWGATLVAVTETGGTVAELQAHLVDRLPAFAAPRRLVARQLPRTSGGKVDRRRLVREILDAGAPEPVR